MDDFIGCAMRISLDQPTFLTSLTEEKPANNQSDQSAGQEDFPNFMSALTQASSADPKDPTTSASEAPIDSDLPPQIKEDLTTDELDALLLSMGYLKQTNPATSPVSTLSETTNQTEAQTLTPGKDGLTQPVTTAQTQGAMTPVMQNNVNLPSVKPNQDQGVSAPSFKIPLKLGEKITTNRHDQASASDMLSQLMTKSTDVSKVKLDSSAKLENTLPELNQGIANSQDQKVMLSFQQMGQWIQAKVNADPGLGKGEWIKAPQSDLLGLQTGLKEGGAATPAKAAWEAKVELSQSMSNAELNLTTYHANIKIYPPELGKVTARMKMDKNVATLEITAENKQVKALIQNHLSNLREQFSQSNIQLNKIEVVLAESKDKAESTLDQQHQGQQEREASEEPLHDIRPDKPKVSKKQPENVVDAYV